MYFPIFHTEGWGQKIRCPAEDNLFRASLGIENGEILYVPARGMPHP